MRLLYDPSHLADVMAMREMNGAQLGRLANVSRQFVHQLRTGTRKSCTDETALAIEVALGLKPGGLFGSSVVTPAVRRGRTGTGTSTRNAA